MLQRKTSKSERIKNIEITVKATQLPQWDKAAEINEKKHRSALTCQVSNVCRVRLLKHCR